MRSHKTAPRFYHWFVSPRGASEQFASSSAPRPQRPPRPPRHLCRSAAHLNRNQPQPCQPLHHNYSSTSSQTRRHARVPLPFPTLSQFRISPPPQPSRLTNFFDCHTHFRPLRPNTWWLCAKRQRPLTQLASVVTSTHQAFTDADSM